MLFSEKKYFDCNEITNIAAFHWPDEPNWKIKIHFSIQDKTGISLPRAPYSGFEFSSNLTTEEQNTAVGELLLFLSKKDISSISIKQISQSLLAQPKDFHQVLLNHGFDFSEEINHHIELSDWKSGLSNMQKRRIKKCQTAGLIFSDSNDFSISNIFVFIKKCRSQQNLEVNIPQATFEKLLHDLQNNFHIHTIQHPDGSLMACLVSILVSKNLVYSFLPAFDRQYSRYSPLAFLFHEYFHELMETEVDILDLGISSIQGHPQTSLIKFKEGIGGIQSSRYSYFKEL